MSNVNSEDLEYDLVPDFEINAIDTNTHDVDPDQDPSTSSAKIQRASEFEALQKQEERQAAVAESSECYTSSSSEGDPPTLSRISD